MARKKSRRPPKKQAVKKRSAKKKPRLTRVTGGNRAVPRKLADTDGQIQRLWHNISEQCISITSSIDTTPSEMIPHEMRERWLRELRKTSVALALLVERLAGGPTAEPKRCPPPSMGAKAPGVGNDDRGGQGAASDHQRERA